VIFGIVEILKKVGEDSLEFFKMMICHKFKMQMKANSKMKLLSVPQLIPCFWFLMVLYFGVGVWLTCWVY